MHWLNLAFHAMEGTKQQIICTHLHYVIFFECLVVIRTYIFLFKIMVCCFKLYIQKLLIDLTFNNSKYVHCKVAHFLKKQKSTKVHFTVLKFWKFLVQFNGNKVDVSKEIKSILIRPHLHIPNTYTSRKKIEIWRKKTTMLRTYENMAHFLPFKSL
jgi:hypothetical protein